jgi:hypothetical protein
MRTSVVLSIAAALAAVAVWSSPQAYASSRGASSVRDHRAAPVVRDHRAPKEVSVRDHRAPKTVPVRQEGPKFIWVDKKGQPGHWERARAEVKSGPTVRDHRKPATPVVRDHRTPKAVSVRDHRAPKKVAPRPLYNHSMSMGGR